MSRSAKQIKFVTISRSVISKKFDLNGFSLRSEALTLFENEIAFRNDPLALDDLFEKIREVLLFDIKPAKAIIDGDLAKSVIEKLRTKEKVALNAEDFIVKNVDWNSVSKAKNYLAHFTNLKTRLVNFLLSNGLSDNMSSVRDLVATPSKEFVVFAYIKRNVAKVSARSLILEDDTDEIEIHLKRNVSAPLIIVNTFAIVNLVYEASTERFIANDVRYPPTSINCTPSPTSPLPPSASDSRVVLLRQIHLDDADTMDMIRVMLTGFNSLESPPDCFVFVGNFLSHENSDSKDFSDLTKTLYKKFLKLLSSYSNLADYSHFIFVPGIGSSARTFPTNPLLDDLFPKSYVSKISVHLGTNPLHLYTRNKRICLFSSNLAQQLNKNGLLIKNDFPEGGQEFMLNLSRVMLSNAFLAPGIYKNFDSSLSLWDSPDLIVCADNSLPAISCNPNSKTQLLNLPSFSEDSFKFKVFYCDSGVVEDSAIC